MQMLHFEEKQHYQMQSAQVQALCLFFVIQNIYKIFTFKRPLLYSSVSYWFCFATAYLQDYSEYFVYQTFTLIKYF